MFLSFSHSFYSKTEEENWKKTVYYLRTTEGTALVEQLVEDRRGGLSVQTRRLISCQQGPSCLMIDHIHSHTDDSLTRVWLAGNKTKITHTNNNWKNIRNKETIDIPIEEEKGQRFCINIIKRDHGASFRLVFFLVIHLLRNDDTE